MTGEQGDWADSAVAAMTAMGRQMASLLRKLAPQPYGLINDNPRLPAFVGSYTQQVPTEHLARGLQNVMPAPITGMTLCYGTPEDPLSPYIEVFTDFTAKHDDTVGLRFALGQAVSHQNALLAGDLQHDGPGRAPRGPLERGRLEIVVTGLPRTVRTQTYHDLHGLQFIQSGLQVTVIARASWPDRPEFALVTDLEPYLAAMESAESEVIKAKLRAHR